MSEYAMLVAIVGMGLVVILGLFGRATKQAWQHSENTFAQEPVAYGGGGGGGGSGGKPFNGGGAGDVQHPPPARPPKTSPDSSSSADSTGAEPDTTQIIQ